MRVLAFCDYFSTESCGGAERVAHEVYRRLVDVHGVDVTVVGTGPRAWSAGRRITRDDDGMRSVFVPGRELSGALGVQLTLSHSLGHVARELITSLRPTVIHANSLHFQGTVAAALRARRCRIPLVTTAHLGAVDMLPTRMRIAAQVWDHTVGRFVIRSSTRIITVSHSVAEYVQRLGASPETIIVARNGIDHTTFHSNGRDDCDAGVLRIGFVGRLIANKGPQLLLKAFEHAHALGACLSLTFVGDGPLRHDLESDVSRAGLGANVTFAGQVHDVASYLRRFDVVVRPSYTEGLPLAVIEAMACGAVVICSNVPGNLELVSDGATGMVFPTGDERALANRLLEVANDRQVLHAMREKAVLRAEELSWDATAESYFQVLQEVSMSGSV